MPPISTMTPCDSVHSAVPEEAMEDAALIRGTPLPRHDSRKQQLPVFGPIAYARNAIASTRRSDNPNAAVPIRKDGIGGLASRKARSACGL